MTYLVIIRIMMGSEIHILVKTYKLYTLNYMQLISICKLNLYTILKIGSK